MTTLDSTIQSVTVFADRAEVIRAAKVKPTVGLQTYVFEGLPANIEPKSIKVDGKGNAVLKDVKYKTVYYDQIPEEDKKYLYDQKEVLLEKQQEINNHIDNINKEKTFIDNVAKKLSGESESLKSIEFEPAKWEKMTDFYRSKITQLDQEFRLVQKDKKELNKKIEKIEFEINLLGQSRRMRRKVEVVADMQDNNEMLFILSYIVYGPSWQPVYDLRADSQNKKVKVEYQALIKQSTGEKWENVRLKLSTARPQLSGIEPELNIWHIDFYRLAPLSPEAERMDENFRSLSRKKESPKLKKKSGLMRGKFDMAIADSFDAEEDMVVEDADVQTGATSVVFDIPGNNTILTNNEQHKVSIAILDFPAEFEYSAIPKLNQLAYLKAKIKNRSDYPFLAGTSNIFLDNSFVANSAFKLVAPDEEFQASLGVDEGIKVEYKFLKRFQKNEGLINKKIKVVYNYQIIIKNNKKTDAKIIVKDQIPVSGNKEIDVELLNPIIKDNKTIKINDEKTILWELLLKPTEQVKLPFDFSVEYPKDEVLTGLE